MKTLSFINLAGVLALGVLCVSQWSLNRALNHEVNRLECIRMDQVSQLEERDTTLAHQAEDLSVLHGQITLLTSDLKETEGNLHTCERENSFLISEREQLKESVKKWAKAVADRDTRLKENHTQIQSLANDLNDVVQRHNELAAAYNDAIQTLNERTQAYNDLVKQLDEAQANGH
jgi:chromosome segregation ATPase